jgi:hypothetical protein
MMDQSVARPFEFFPEPIVGEPGDRHQLFALKGAERKVDKIL